MDQNNQSNITQTIPDNVITQQNHQPNISDQVVVNPPIANNNSNNAVYIVIGIIVSIILFVLLCCCCLWFGPIFVTIPFMLVPAPTS
jgi:hypothetical protein